jgi:hypothetical protein
LGNQPIAILVWKDGTVCHECCQSEYLRLEKYYLNLPSLIEAAARKRELSVAGFLEGVPSWERNRSVLPELELAYPDWESRIRQTLQSAINGTATPLLAAAQS